MLSSLVFVFAWSLSCDREGAGPLRVDGPDFEKQAKVEARVFCGNLCSFLEAPGYDEPVAADDFLGFAKRAVRHHIFS